MRCLTCGVDMKITVVEGVEIDICTRCGGVWLDGGELETLTGHSLENCRELKCPNCSKKMAIRTIGPVEVDYCVGCGGTWLDEGELDAVRHIPGGKGMDVGRFTQFLKSLTHSRNMEIAKEASVVDGGDLLILDNVFLIHRNGLLITSLTEKNAPNVDEDILAGMLVAIQNFVEVSFDSAGGALLHGIKFGDRQIILERGDYLVTALLVSGNVPPHFSSNVRKLLKTIEERYPEQLCEWSGNLNDLEGVDELIEDIFMVSN